jgi:hypothetical protein
MLADPLTITLNAVAFDCARIQVSPNQATYKDATGNVQIILKQNQSAARMRHEFRVVQNKVAADPISAVNKALSASYYLVVDEPLFGFTDAELEYLRAGFHTLITTGSPSNYYKWLQGQM